MGIKIIDTPEYKEKKTKEKYIENGIVVFLSVYGSIAYILSALKIEYYSFLLAPLLLMISIACAFVHQTKKSAIIGYSVMLPLYGGYVMGCSTIINSGFNHCLNVFYKTIDTRYILGIDKEYQEIFENNILSVTMLALAIGFAMAIMVNMLVSESMNGFAIAFLELGFLLIPWYLGAEGSILSCIMLITAPLAAMFVKNTGKFGLYDNMVSYKNKPPRYLFTKLINKIKPESKKSFENTYTQKGYFKSRVMPKIVARQMLVISMLTMAVTLGLSAVAPYSLIDGHDNPIEIKLRPFVKDFAMYGFDIFWNKGEMFDGNVMNGIINDTGMVRFDNQTDLKVTFAPVNYDRVLLKGYVGSYYTGKAWKSIEEITGIVGLKIKHKSYDKYLYEKFSGKAFSDFICEQYKQSAVDYTSNRLKKYSDKAGTVHRKMRIENNIYPYTNMFVPYYVNAKENKNIYPDMNEYWDFNTEGVVSKNIAHGQSYEIMSYVADNNEALINNDSQTEEDKEKENAYRHYVSETYMDNTTTCEYIANEFIETYNLRKIYDGYSEDESKKKYYNTKGFDYNEEMRLVKQVMKIFDEDYTYTLVPGKTPQKYDFAEYFLLYNRRGFCVHFATSAVIILRQLGIPARYCEGYAIDQETWEEITDVDVNENEWIEGATTSIGIHNKSDKTKTKVVTANVTDACGHAWIEIYADGIGWIPIDVTPASDEEEDEQGNEPSPLVVAIQNFASGAAKIGGGLAGIFGIVTNNKTAIVIAIISILFMIILVWILSILICNGILIWQMKKAKTQKAIVVIANYARKLLRMSGFDKNETLTFMECAKKARQLGNFDMADAICILIPMQKLIYGDISPIESDRVKAYEAIKKLSKNIYDNLKWYKKISFFIVRRMMVIK